jgi:hypothetical protein
MMGEWMSGSSLRRVCVYNGAGPTDAFLVRDHLVAHGLPVEVRGQHLGGLVGAIPVADTFPSLWVVDRHAQRARDLIAEWDADLAPGGRPWMCACGAEVDAHFGECWSCGTAKI